ncbi:hypothetical protein AB0H58_32470 [Nocardia neocaledoniensis]|uniref:hypothetical protein n=1 Tax=Nocardia neocaledoniensis TaxID=236511 RepID=UPI003408FA31
MSQHPDTVSIRLLGRSRDGVTVRYDDSVTSHAAGHFRDTPGLLAAATDAISRASIAVAPRVITLDVGYIAGLSDLVPIQPGDETFYAKRAHRDVYTVFNRTRAPWPCSLVTFVLEAADSRGDRLLRTAWVGPAAPCFPGDPNESPESRPFWRAHALAWGAHDIQPGTETAICPW